MRRPRFSDLQYTNGFVGVDLCVDPGLYVSTLNFADFYGET